VLFPLKTFRKNRRLAIVVGGPTAVAEAREMATQVDADNGSNGSIS